MRTGTKPHRIFGYCRVSGAEQARSGTSLDGQRDEIVRWCAAQDFPAPTRIAVEVESGSAARTEARREQLQIEKDATSGDIVVVAAFDRWSRDVVHAVSTIRRLVSRGVRWIAIREWLDASTPSGDALLGLLAWVAEQERARIRARTVGRRRELADLGLYVAGRLPLGYRRDDGRRLAVDAEEAALVREIFTRCSAGESLSDIASTLPPAREKARWTVYRVHRVLRSRYVLGETRRGDGSWALGNHPALVSHDLWDRAHVALRARVAGGRKYTQGESAQRLLRGLVKCSACGRRVSVRFGARHQLPDASGARVHYYVCRGVLAGRACGEGWIRSYEADAAAAEKVMARLTEIREHLAAPPSVVPRRERSTSVAVGLAKIEERKRKAVDLATDGAMSAAVLQETIARYETEAAALRLRAEREETQRMREERVADPESRAQLLRHVGALRASWAAMGVAQRQEVLALLAEEIQVGRGGVQIRWRSVAALAEAPGGDHLVTQP